MNHLNAARSAAITRLDARAVRELPPGPANADVLAATATALGLSNTTEVFGAMLDALREQHWLRSLDRALVEVVARCERESTPEAYRARYRARGRGINLDWSGMARALIERGADFGRIERHRHHHPAQAAAEGNAENLLVRAVRADDPDLVGALVANSGEFLGAEPAVIMQLLVDASSQTRAALRASHRARYHLRPDAVLPPEADGQTALHRIITAHLDEPDRDIEFFLWLGADPLLRDAAGRTPRDCLLAETADFETEYAAQLHLDFFAHRLASRRAAARRLLDAEHARLRGHNVAAVDSLRQRGVPDELLRGISAQAGLAREPDASE